MCPGINYAIRVLYVLYINRPEYKKSTFWLLFGNLLSVLLYLLGDEKNNLFVQAADWFLFDSSLFITFLFLFFRYYKNGKEKFNRMDWLFFIPNLVYFIIESIELILVEEHLLVEVIEISTELIFIIYLSSIIYSIFTMKKKHWTLYFAIPIVVLFGLSSLNDIFRAMGWSELTWFSNQNSNTYLLLIVAFLFYFISFKLVKKKQNHQMGKEQIFVN